MKIRINENKYLGMKKNPVENKHIKEVRFLYSFFFFFFLLVLEMISFSFIFKFSKLSVNYIHKFVVHACSLIHNRMLIKVILIRMMIMKLLVMRKMMNKQFLNKKRWKWMSIMKRKLLS